MSVGFRVEGLGFGDLVGIVSENLPCMVQGGKKRSSRVGAKMS